MSRTSRIPHPPGSRYVAIHNWAVKRFGLAGAAVIGLLDFFNRAADIPDQPLASRQRILAELEGIAGRDAIDHALKTLQNLSLIQRHEFIKPGKKNFEKHVLYSLQPLSFARLFASPDFRSSGDSWNQESLELLKSGLKSGVPSIYIEIEKAVAAPCACVRSSDAAATDGGGKRRRQRKSGIVVWDQDDLIEAERIEQQHNVDVIGAAVAALLAASKEPVPGLVDGEISRQRRVRDMSERRAAAEAAHQALLDAAPSDDGEATAIVYARGLSLLPPALRARVTNAD